MWKTAAGGRRGVRRVTATVLLLSLLAGLLVSIQVGVAQAASFPPEYLRTIGGSGRPGDFSWGVQYNPVTNEILEGDYLNFQIRRYDLNGNHLGDFWRDDAYGQPYTIAVDPHDGSIYVGELKDNPLTVGIAKYDKDGNFLYAIPATLFGSSNSTRIRAFYIVWMTVEEDTGDLWFLDSHFTNTVDNPPRVLHYRFDDATQTVEELGQFPVLPPGTTDNTTPRLYGIDVGDDNRIYLSDAWNRRAYIYDQQGNLLSTFGQTQTGGDNREVVINEDLDRVYLVDAQYSQIDVFNLDGGYLFSFGGEGTDPGEFQGGGRQADVDGDGNLWVADFGGFELEKYSPNGTPLLTAPSPPRKPPVGQLAQPRDVAIDDQTGQVWVADAWAQRFQRFSSTGTSLGSYGFRGSGGPFQMNYPRSIAINPANRQIWVANERGHHIQVYNYPNGNNASPTYVAQIGQIGSDDTDPGHFRWPVDIEFYQPPTGNMRAIIGDRMASSVKIFDAITRQELVMIPAANHGTAVDPATGNIYVVNPSQDRIEVWDQNGDQVLDDGGSPFRFGSRGNGDGQFQDGVDGVISDGILYVSDESLSRIQAFDLNGNFLGRWGATYGDGSYDFRNPVGLDVDAQGRLYVTDSGNDRIQVFDPGHTKLNDPTNPANPAIASPANQAVLPLGPVTMTGTATDNLSVGNVEISIQDLNTGQWWNPANSSWVDTSTRSAIAAWTSTNAPATSVNWRYTFHGVSLGGVYLMQVKTRDSNGNLSQLTQRTFGMPGTSPPPPPPPPVLDTVRPDGTVTFPSTNAQLPFADVTFTGTATDDTGVDRMLVAIKRLSNNTWYTGSGSTGFSSTFVWWEAALDTPGGTSTGWSFSWTPSSRVVPGDFRILARAVDTAGNIDQALANVPFSVTSDAPDGVAPDTTIALPADGSDLPTGSVTITGTATDDTSIASVGVTIEDTDAGTWWTGSGWAASPTTVTASLSSPGSATTDWSYVFGASAAGNYRATAVATDGSGNVDADPTGAIVAFSEAGAADTDPPVTTVGTPSPGESVAAPVMISGDATDNVGVAQVRVAIRNNSLPNGSNWWNGSGWGPYTYVPADLSSAGEAATAWSYVFDAPASGSYGLQVRSLDTSANLGSPAAWQNFNATVGGTPDTTPPGTTVSTPLPGSTSSSPVTIAGDATDDVGVAVVRVAIRNNALPAGSNWWTGTGWGPYTYLMATLASPGGTSTAWSYVFDATASGSYGLQVRSVDTSNNLGSPAPWRNFMVA
jgi:NHL repeat/Bacterial Ig domain